jgi:hypothetical protein
MEITEKGVTLIVTPKSKKREIVESLGYRNHDKFELMIKDKNIILKKVN